MFVYYKLAITCNDVVFVLGIVKIIVYRRRFNFTLKII